MGTREASTRRRIGLLAAWFCVGAGLVFDGSAAAQNAPPAPAPTPSAPTAPEADATTALPRGEDVMESVVRALGGEEAIAKVKKRVCVGRVNIDSMKLTGDFTLKQEAPSKMHMSMTMQTIGAITRGYDGATAWEVSEQRLARVLEGVEKAIAVRGALMAPEAAWRTLYTKVECTGEEKVGEADCWRLELTPAAIEGAAPEAATELLIDKKTWLPARQSMNIPTEMGMQPVAQFFEDYQEHDGVLLAHTTRHRLLGLEQVVTVDSVKQNDQVSEKEIGPKTFEPPEKIAKLLQEKAAGVPAGAPAPAPEGAPKKD